jgi:formate-dependent nitrite reductase membrane component NrfD
MITPEGALEPAYYGVPFLKRPRWRWEIAFYFFLEGISSGTYVLATMADLFAKGRYPELVRYGRYVSLATLLPCPPLLIADLGRPERFHHMLRIVKLTSPMNTGAWALTAFGPFAALAAACEWAGRSSRANSTLGLPFALTMLAYPGVLLSATSTPVWARTPFLGALLGCSSMSAAVSTLALVSSIKSRTERLALQRMETVTAVGEAAAVAAYLLTAKRAAQPLTKGTQAGKFLIGAVALGIIVPTALRVFQSRRPGRAGRNIGMLASVLSLAGSLMLKWAITHAGQESALDQEASHFATRPSSSAPGWVPNGA